MRSLSTGTKARGTRQNERSRRGTDLAHVSKASTIDGSLEACIQSRSRTAGGGTATTGFRFLRVATPLGRWHPSVISGRRQRQHVDALRVGGRGEKGRTSRAGGARVADRGRRLGPSHGAPSEAQATSMELAATTAASHHTSRSPRTGPDGCHADAAALARTSRQGLRHPQLPTPQRPATAVCASDESAKVSGEF